MLYYQHIPISNSTPFPQLKELPVSGPNANRRRVVSDVFEDAYNYMKSGQLMRQVINRISGVDFNDLAERKPFGDIYGQLLNDLQSAGNVGEYDTPIRGWFAHCGYPVH